MPQRGSSRIYWDLHWAGSARNLVVQAQILIGEAVGAGKSQVRTGIVFLVETVFAVFDTYGRGPTEQFLSIGTVEISRALSGLWAVFEHP